MVSVSSSPSTSPSHLSSARLLEGVRGRRFQVSAEDVDRLAKLGGCSICTADWAVDETALELECSHTFHAGCLVAWLAKQPTCPNCRCEAMDIAFVVNDLVCDLRAVVSEGKHHHDLLPFLEKLGALSRDGRFVAACTKSCSCLAELAHDHPCPLVRGLVLEIFLVLSREKDLRSSIDEVRKCLFPVLHQTIASERPALRAVTCGLLWNLAIGGPGRDEAVQIELDEFFIPILDAVTDDDPTVSHRATRALFFLARDSRRPSALDGRLDGLLRRADEWGPNEEDTGIILQIFSFLLEDDKVDAEEQEPRWKDKLMDAFFENLQVWVHGHHAARFGALRCVLHFSQCSQQRHKMLGLFELGGPLRRLLWHAGNGNFPATWTCEESVAARQQAVGIAWNLALDANSRRPLARQVLNDLLAIGCEGECLDAITRERLVTALFHFSKDEVVAQDAAWIGAVQTVCLHVELLIDAGVDQMFGVNLLGRLTLFHKEAIAVPLIEWVWHKLVNHVEEKTLPGTGLFVIFLTLTSADVALTWLLRQGDAEHIPSVLARLLEMLSSHVCSSSRHPKAQLVGGIWNLAMRDDDANGRNFREVLGKYVLPFAPDLLGDANPELVRRSITATYHLLKSPPNANLLFKIVMKTPDHAKSFGGRLITMLRLFPDDETKSQILQFVVAMFDCGGKDGNYASFKFVLCDLLQYFGDVEFFGATPINASPRAVNWALRLLLLLSSVSAEVCKEFILWPPLQRDGSVLAFIEPDVYDDLALGSRQSVLGIVWNLAIYGDLRLDLADRALDRLLAVLDSAFVDDAGIPGKLKLKLDVITCLRLVTALDHLCKEHKVATSQEIADAAPALARTVLYFLGGDGGRSYCKSHVEEIVECILEMFFNMCGSQSVKTAVLSCALPSAMLIVDRLLMHEPGNGGYIISSRMTAGVCCMILAVSQTQIGKDALWGLPIQSKPQQSSGSRTTVSQQLAKTLGLLNRCGRPMERARARLTGAFWNVAMDVDKREALGAAAMLELFEAIDVGGVDVARHAATCLRWLAESPKNLPLMNTEQFWDAAQSEHVKDDSCSHICACMDKIEKWLRTGAGSAVATPDLCTGRATITSSIAIGSGHRKDSCDTDLEFFRERALKFLSDKKWLKRSKPRSSWWKTTGTELSLLISLCQAATVARFLDSDLLKPGGHILDVIEATHEALLVADKDDEFTAVKCLDGAVVFISKCATLAKALPKCMVRGCRLVILARAVLEHLLRSMRFRNHLNVDVRSNLMVCLGLFAAEPDVAFEACWSDHLAELAALIRDPASYSQAAQPGFQLLSALLTITEGNVLRVQHLQCVHILVVLQSLSRAQPGIVMVICNDPARVSALVGIARGSEASGPEISAQQIAAAAATELLDRHMQISNSTRSAIGGE